MNSFAKINSQLIYENLLLQEGFKKEKVKAIPELFNCKFFSPNHENKPTFKICVKVLCMETRTFLIKVVRQ